MKTNKKYIADTSVIIEKAVSKLIKEDKIKGTILIPHAVVAELENQANHGQEIGFLGLEELQNLQELKNKQVEVTFIGDRPNEFQIRKAKSGEIDAYIREMACKEKAVLITADKVQAASGKAFGLEVMYLQLRVTKEKLEIEKFFDETTMSVHLKEKCLPVGKKGKPGNWQLVPLTDKRLTGKEIEDIYKEIIEKSRIDEESFIEISRRGSTIIQYRDYRIVVVRPPVSDGWEITAVHPLKHLAIEDYHISPILFERIKNQARGVIVAGETGSGKSTFSQAVAEYWAQHGRITKTVESPRDLKLIDEITQYSKNLSSSEEIHDILFLSRPDNIVFDEMRDTPDFQLYTDLRLAGSNMLGVLHAAAPIDAVQRFISRLDTGMIPSVLDTIVYMAAGTIQKVLTLRMIVKVPSGMMEADLARPVIEIRDFETNALEYEIYSYGEETVVIPVQTEKKQGMKLLAAQAIEKEFKRYADQVEVDVISDARAVVSVPDAVIAKIIGTGGKNIDIIEKKLGISIEVRELQQAKKTTDFKTQEDRDYLIFYAEPGTNVDINVNGTFVCSAITSRKGEIKIHKKSKLGRELLKAMHHNHQIELKI